MIKIIVKKKIIIKFLKKIIKMDDFEELLISESDDDNKNEINNQYYDININNIKIPSNDIFKGLLSDDSEESNKIIEINKKKKEDKKIK